MLIFKDLLEMDLLIFDIDISTGN